MTPRKQKLSHNRAFQQERLVQSENYKTNDFRRQNLFSFVHLKEKGNKTSHPAESLLRQSEINALLKIILLFIIC